MPELEFLGHSLSAAGLVPLPRQVEAVKAFARPRDVKQLQCFLGIINFYRRFIPKAGAILKPLTDSLIGSPKSLAWTPAMDSAFSAAKAALVAAVPLVHPNSNAEIFLACDALATHGACRPLSFFSRKLSPPELKYSAFDCELLAVYSLVKNFRFFLEGRKFSIFSDHKRLATALYRTSLSLSAWVQCQLSFIAEITAELHYLPGMSNVVAEALSRPLLPLAVVAALTACNRVPGTWGLISWKWGVYNKSVQRWPPFALPPLWLSLRCQRPTYVFLATFPLECSALWYPFHASCGF